MKRISTKLFVFKRSNVNFPISIDTRLYSWYNNTIGQKGISDIDCIICGKNTGNDHGSSKYCKDHNNWMKRNKGSPKTEKGLILARLKYQSKKKNVPFDLSEEDIDLPEYCPILGIKLDYKYSMGNGDRNFSATVDKIIPEFGYIKGNVKIISARANRLKNDATIEEVKSILKYLEQI